MIKLFLNLNNIDRVKGFVALANTFDFDIDVSVKQYTVDGKSIMGLFSLNLMESVTVTIRSNSAEATRLANELCSSKWGGLRIDKYGTKVN